MSVLKADAMDPKDGRRETPEERSDRNWEEMLQELRVVQTGTQILAGFLLTLAFQPRFAELDDYQRLIYLLLVVAAVLATVLALSPVSLHRGLFGRHAKGAIVKVANYLMKATIAAVALTLAGTAMLIFDVVVSRAAGLVAGTTTLVLVLIMWLAIPWRIRAAHRS